MAARKSYRPARIAELLKEEIGQVINYELDDPRIRPATVIQVSVSPDLRHARVHLSVLGSRHEVDETVRQLNHAASYIRQQLYPRLYLRVIPQIIFSIDDSLEAANRLDQLFNEDTMRLRE